MKIDLINMPDETERQTRNCRSQKIRYTTREISKWREVLEYFDAIKIGLTATPAEHTTAYFKEIVFRYEYERAVREGYLVDCNAVRIKSDVRINGVFLREGETVGLIDTETGLESLDMLEDADDLPEPDELAGEAITHLEAAINGLQEVLFHLNENNDESRVD